MIKDYHLHPNLLNAPEQTEKFINAAVEKGINEVCFTDHMPLSVSNASDRIPRGKVKEYCQRVREISRRFGDRITVKCGIEIDYHPSVIGEVESVLDEGDFDYVLGSTHMHVFIKDFPRYSFNDFAEISLENSILAAESGYFNAISHLDMYRFVFENPKRFPLKDDGYDLLNHETVIKGFLNVIKDKQVRLEINPHLAEGKKDLTYTYPQEIIVKWALEKGCLFSYGSDAHAPESVGAYLDELRSNSAYSQALEIWERAL